MAEGTDYLDPNCSRRLRIACENDELILELWASSEPMIGVGFQFTGNGGGVAYQTTVDSNESKALLDFFEKAAAKLKLALNDRPPVLCDGVSTKEASE